MAAPRLLVLRSMLKADLNHSTGNLVVGRCVAASTRKNPAAHVRVKGDGCIACPGLLQDMFKKHITH